MARRHLTCACCGDYAGLWQQHFNRDAGFGICRACVDRMIAHGTTPAQIVTYYGIEGENYPPTTEESTTTKGNAS